MLVTKKATSGFRYKVNVPVMLVPLSRRTALLRRHVIACSRRAASLTHLPHHKMESFPVSLESVYAERSPKIAARKTPHRSARLKLTGDNDVAI
jgi:hypothetical protein